MDCGIGGREAIHQYWQKEVCGKARQLTSKAEALQQEYNQLLVIIYIFIVMIIPGCVRSPLQEKTGLINQLKLYFHHWQAHYIDFIMYHIFVFYFQSIIPTTVDDSIPLQEEEMSLDSIETLPLVTMEVPSTPVSCHMHITSSCDLFCDPVQESRIWRWVFFRMLLK